MTHKKIKLSITIFAFLIAIVCGCFNCLVVYNNAETISIQASRTIEVDINQINYQSVLDSFENSEIKTEGTLTTFEGCKTLDWSDFEEFDNVSEEDFQSSIGCQVKYNVTYDAETNVVTLSASMENEDTLTIEDIYGSAFIDESGRLDAVMCLDGEYILLSEMQNLGLIQNCGWFSNLFKKIVKITVAVVSVAACVATAGMAIGAVIAIGAAVSAAESVTTQLLETGTVCLAALAVDTALGAIPGGSGAKAVAKEGVQAITQKAAKEAGEKVCQKEAKEAGKNTAVNIKAEIGSKLEYAFGKATGSTHNITRSMDNASALSKIGIYNNKSGRQLLTEHFDKALNDNRNIIFAKNAVRVETSTVLSGPGGLLNVKSIWEGEKLITFWFVG